MDIRKQVGANLRRMRLARGLSQEAFAHDAGIDRTYISGVERGVRNPTVLMLHELATALGVEPAELLKKPPRR